MPVSIPTLSEAKESHNTILTLRKIPILSIAYGKICGKAEKDLSTFQKSRKIHLLSINQERY